MKTGGIGLKRLAAILMSVILLFGCLPLEAAYAEDNGAKRDFISYNLGFVCKIPISMQERGSIEDVAARLEGPDGSRIYIYSQDIKGMSPQTYIYYSNKQIRAGRGGFTMLDERTTTLASSAKAYEFLYQRDAISNIENDKNVYFEINAVYPQFNRVLTFWVKTDSANLDYYTQLARDMASSAWLFEKGVKRQRAPYVQRDIDIKGNSTRLKIGKDSMMWGIMHPHNLNGADYTSNLVPFEASLGKKFEFLMTYSDFEHNVNLKEVNEVYADERVMMLTWQPWVYIDKTQNENIENESAVLIPEIIKGSYDDYIRGWARDIKSIGEPVFVRFANEMNGDWDSWCAWYFGKDTELYNEAWKRIEKIFREEGADNAQFVWNPHDRSYPDFDWNSPHMYYPGDEHVDWVGLTGYNNGTSFTGDVWREFGDIYQPVYDDYMKHYREKPFMITEFSCNEDGGDKAAWIRNGFSSLANMPNIKAAVWFNQIDTRWLYNIDSSEASFAAFKESMKNPLFSVKNVHKEEELLTQEKKQQEKTESNKTAKK